MFLTLFAFAKSGPLTESSVIVKSTFGNCDATVASVGASRYPAAETMFAPSRTAVVRFGR